MAERADGSGPAGGRRTLLTDPRVQRFQAEVLPCLAETFARDRVLVFGSRARGDALAHSDLDILVVSSGFEQIRWLDRPLRVAEACEIRFGVQLLCYTPEEFERKREELGIVRTTVEEGIDLLTAVQ